MERLNEFVSLKLKDNLFPQTSSMLILMIFFNLCLWIVLYYCLNFHFFEDGKYTFWYVELNGGFYL